MCSTCVARMAPLMPRILVTIITITVELPRRINIPIINDMHICAQKTILLIVAISVSMPRMRVGSFH